MEQTSVQKLARVLRVLVLITFVCNLIALLLVPPLAAVQSACRMNDASREYSLIELIELIGQDRGFWLKFTVRSWNPFRWVMGIAGGRNQERYWGVLTLFLLFCGVCTAVILWQGKRVLDTILQGEPFTLGNAHSLKRAATCCFLISGAAFLRLIWGFATYRSIMPLLTYNALFVPIFLMAGLLCMVMSALFRQAAELKAENDLTI